jgi:predicted dehydrogenase
MKALIIGTGSIGKRHIRNLQNLDAVTQFLLLRDKAYEDDFSRSLGAEVVGTMDKALSLKPDFALIATPSCKHMNALAPLIEAHIPVYIEKPVVTTQPDIEQLQSHLNSTQYTAPNLVGCNFRFLPSLCKVREVVLSGGLGNIVRANLVVGQWLPDWRPQQDYRQSYSAQSDMGGGVIMDLIHEIDMARWLFGEFDQVRAMTGKFSSLDITSEDTACIILGKIEGPPVVSLSLDYVSRRRVRRYEIVGEEGTLSWDLGEQRLEISRSQSTERIECGKSAFDVAETYRTAMKEFVDAVHHKRTTSPDIKDGLKSVELALTAKEEG